MRQQTRGQRPRSPLRANAKRLVPGGLGLEVLCERRSSRDDVSIRDRRIARGLSTEGEPTHLHCSTSRTRTPNTTSNHPHSQSAYTSHPPPPPLHHPSSPSSHSDTSTNATTPPSRTPLVSSTALLLGLPPPPRRPPSASPPTPCALLRPWLGQ